MELEPALQWAAGHRLAVLITIRSDGRPQSSDIVYGLVDGRFLISITADRAKTRNLRRDPRSVLHISHESSGSYLAFDGTAELVGPAEAVDDEVADLLVEYFRACKGEDHSDWDEYRQAMVDDRRLLAVFTPASVVGQLR